MAIQQVALEITGTTTLIMQKDTLADPLHPATKAFKKISGKRVKTDEDHEAMARMEFMAGLYLDDEKQVIMPLRNVKKCLIEGARITKAGKKVERGVLFNGLAVPLEYEGPRTPEELYADPDFVSRMTVVVARAKTIRVRPRFIRWGLSAQLFVDTAVLNLEELSDIAVNAGRMEGLGTYRASGGFGRFDAKVRVLSPA